MPVSTVLLPETHWTAALRDRVGILFRVLCYWMIWFSLARALFHLWFRDLAPENSAGLVAQSFLYGARMDLATAAYLTTVPWLILTVTVALPTAIARRALALWATFIVVFVPLVTMTDIGIFRPWRKRLDATLWTYLATPREAYASAASIPVVPLFGALGVMLLVTWWSYRRFVRRGEAALSGSRGLHAVAATIVLLAIGATLAIPIRGGVQWTPINESTVFFSRSEFENMAALNPGWSLLASTVAQQNVPSTNPFVVLPDGDVKQVVDSLYPISVAQPQSVLRVQRPNVILIIWESFTAKVVERLGGRRGVTPEFDRWTHNGILFDSIFASGERSAQGLVSLLSGFPSVPKEAIMTRPQKAARLPQLGQLLSHAGYYTSFYYGGELEFANMKAYILIGGFARVTGIAAFAAADRNSKWGAHDHVVLGRALGELQHEPRPFFSTIVTLSSHEPFDVPAASAFTGEDESARFLNAHHYSDASIGRFLDSASHKPWWDSTLVVIVADHGSPLPEPAQGSTESVVDRHHIAMLWLGGALRVKDTVVHRIGASVDVAPSVLGQLGIPAQGFRWGSDLFTGHTGGFAYFDHNDGFGFVDGGGWLVYDERGRRILGRSASAGARQQRIGTALLQASFGDYLAR